MNKYPPELDDSTLSITEVVRRTDKWICKVARPELIRRNWTPTFRTEEDQVKGTPEPTQIGDPDERSDNVLSVQYTASTPPTVAAETPIAERDAPAVNPEQPPVVAKPSATPLVVAAKTPIAELDAPAERDAFAMNSEQPPSPAMAADTPTATPVASAGKRKKRSTRKGEGRTKLLSALASHHKYSQSGCLNFEPIGCNEIAKLVTVSGSTASEFFVLNFGDHLGYTAICRDAKRLHEKLKSLYDEYADPSYGSEPM